MVCASRSGAVRQVSSIGRRAERGVCPTDQDCRTSTRSCPVQRPVANCTNGRKRQSSQPSNSGRASQFRAPTANTSTKAKRKVTHRGGCVFRELQVQCKRVLASTLCLVAKALANPSLNRTHCGVPSFGLEKPSPNASPPQRAG